MKFVYFVLVVCAVASTGFAKPVDSEQLPPIGGPLMAVHPLMINYAQDLMVKVKENLEKAGHHEDAQHLSLFIQETEKLMNKAQNGQIQVSENHEFNDHLVAVYEALEHYKEFLPANNNYGLHLPKTKKLVEHLSKKMDALIVKLKDRKDDAKVKLLEHYKNVLDTVKFGKKLLNPEELKAMIMLMAYFAKNHYSNFETKAFSGQSADFVRSLLDSVVLDLEKIEAGLKADKKYVEYGKVKLHKAIAKAVSANTHGGNTNRKSVQYALDRGIELIKQYEQYLTKKSQFGFAKYSSYSDEDDHMPDELDQDEKLVDIDDNKDDDNSEDLPNEQEEKEGLSQLEKLRQQLSELRDKLRARRRSLRVRIVESYIKVLDMLIARLQKHNLDKSRINDMVVRARELLEKHANDNRDFLWSSNDDENLLDLDDEEDQPDPEPEDLDKAEEDKEMNDDDEQEDDEEENVVDEKEEKENVSKFEELRKKLVETRDKLRKQRRSLRVRIVETYINVLDRLMERLKRGKLNNDKVNSFLERVREMLENHANDHRDFLWSSNDDESLLDLDDEQEDDDQEDVAEKKEENVSKFEELRKKLVEMKDKLRTQRRSLRVRIVETYINVLDRLIERLKKGKLNNDKVNSFLERVREMLENHANDHRD